jgi:DNA repair protein RecO (recombination protein O)
MRVADKALVLQAIKHGDKKFIVKLFSRTNGIVTASCVTSSSPKSKIKPAAVLPLTLLNAEFIIKENKEVQQLTEASCYHVYLNIHQSLSKLSIAQFVNEILIKSLKGQPASHHLFDFLEFCFCYLDEHDNINNLHLHFLVNLSIFLGIEPQNNYSSNDKYFNCREGNFTASPQLFPLGLAVDDSRLFSECLQINLLQTQLTHASRQNLIEAWLAYYSYHIPGFGVVKSVEILKEVFAHPS